MSLATNHCVPKESIVKGIRSRGKRPSRINRLVFQRAVCVVDSRSSITCSNYRLPTFYKNVKRIPRLQNGKYTFVCDILLIRDTRNIDYVDGDVRGRRLGFDACTGRLRPFRYDSYLASRYR